jgi:hypothetical protein
MDFYRRHFLFAPHRSLKGLPDMGHLSQFTLLAICMATPAFAQDSPRLDRPAPDAAAFPSGTPTALTGKERLGPKWMDEQRIDNCKVPIDKRGTKPRSSHCTNVPVG